MQQDSVVASVNQPRAQSYSPSRADPPSLRDMILARAPGDGTISVPEALTYLADGKIKPRTELYPLERANEVRERLAAGKVLYRAVLQHAQ